MKAPKLCPRCNKRPRVKYRAWCETCEAHAKLADSIAIFLNTIGWMAIVVGEVKITHQPGEDRNFNYNFVVRFTGKQVKPPNERESR